jgi:hypothetical protein
VSDGSRTKDGLTHILSYISAILIDLSLNTKIFIGLEEYPILARLGTVTLHGHTRCINQRLRPQPHMRQRQRTEPALHSAQHTSQQAAAAIVQNGINAVTLHVYMQHPPVKIRFRRDTYAAACKWAGN